VRVRNELDVAFVQAREEARAALIPYLTGGYPDPRTFIGLAIALLEAGADALEIGIPFSDPLLDGPSIQRSQQQALEHGVTPAHCLQYAADIRARTAKPLLFMGAYNPILAYGVERFCRDGAQAGISGLIIPDVPYEEQDELRSATSASHLHLIQLVAPTSTAERLQRVCSAASGFVYCISIAGVTGARSGVSGTAKPLVEAVRACTDVPVAVGFGISGPEQARQVAGFADGVIVGSALIDVIAHAPEERRLEAVQTFISSLRNGVEASPVR
jgi:tryptophan synthase alpha chain